MEEKQTFTREEVAKAYQEIWEGVAGKMNWHMKDCARTEDYETAIKFRDSRRELLESIDVTFAKIGFSDLPF